MSVEAVNVTCVIIIAIIVVLPGLLRLIADIKDVWK